ncbi:MAG TPA: HEAT repeat domain-containing protein [Phycisphaerae bacterium]|nr:HEAT repeat domain-containing protein [Phycisphaerae bacterium]
MSVRQSILSTLTGSENLAVERIIELALPDALPHEQIELADVLLERNRRAGWVTLIRTFHRLEESIRSKILSRPRDLFGPLAECSHEPEGPTRQNVINIVRLVADGKLVYLLAEALMDPRTEVRELAGKTLLEAIRRHMHDHSADPADESAVQHQITRALDFAIRQYRTHRQPPALLAALINERQQTGRIWDYFQDTYEEITRAATGILRSPGDPGLGAAILIALASPLRTAAMAGISGADGPIGEAVAHQSFRLLDPVLRDSAQTIQHLKCVAGARKDPPWTQATWPAWLRLVETVGLDSTKRLLVYTRMLETMPADAPACTVVWKLELLRALFDISNAESARLICALTGDGDERVARCAARYLLHKRRPEWRPLAAAALPKSPHISVRRLAIGLHVPNTSRAESRFEKTWNEYPKLPPAVQHTATRVADDKDPTFAERLRVKLASSAPHEIAQGLKMISALPDLTPFRGQIISLCGNADARIVAVAVRLVGRLEDPRLKDLLEAAAHHSDPRVRANAVESMETLHIADRSQQVLAMLNSRHNRERANAIKAISQFDFATARECLSRMLADPNPIHRVSALWVVSQIHMLELVRQVNAMARKDPNMRVRRRAADMVETLTGAPGSVISSQ